MFKSSRRSSQVDRGPAAITSFGPILQCVQYLFAYARRRKILDAYDKSEAGGLIKALDCSRFSNKARLRGVRVKRAFAFERLEISLGDDA